jgi:hypothetical protein
MLLNNSVVGGDADADSEDPGGYQFRSIVELKASTRQDGVRHKLMPGMQVDAGVALGQRSVSVYGVSRAQAFPGLRGKRCRWIAGQGKSSDSTGPTSPIRLPTNHQLRRCLLEVARVAF